MRRRSLLVGSAAAAAAALPAASLAQADAVETLRGFVRDVKSGSAQFTQVVTSTDGVRRRTSSGRFEFQRPNRFRFEYARPFEQTIVADGEKVWIYDAELNQASSRRLAQAMGATPAALLAGGSLDADFELRNDGRADGIDWALALPRTRDGPFERLRVGFRAGTLAAVEIVDSFGQRSRLDFADFVANARIPAARWHFTPPPGADVIEQ